MDDFMRIQQYLRPGEQLLWCGSPDPAVWFTTADLYLIPFSIAWCGFAIFWEAGASGGGPFFAAWGAMFVVIGLYMVIGRFFYKHYRKKQTVYGITTQRALVVVGARSLTDSPWLGTPITIQRSRDSRHASVILEGTGTPARSFGRRNTYRGWPANSGFDAFPWRSASGPVAFYDVADPDTMLAALDQARGLS